jgi:hypothetical protein
VPSTTRARSSTCWSSVDVTATRHKAPIYDRARLGAGDHIDGPAIITQLGATTLLLLGQTAEIHPLRRLFVHANLSDETRYWWFESTPLQRGVWFEPLDEVGGRR